MTMRLVPPRGAAPRADLATGSHRRFDQQHGAGTSRCSAADRVCSRLSRPAATPSTTVTWWSNNWYLLNSLSGGAAPPPFKGFVASAPLPNTTPANICSGSWVTSGGNSPPPPATVPSYMGVIVPTKITKSGNNLNGNYVKIVVVKTNPGYAPGPNNTGTGTIVATFCQ